MLLSPTNLHGKALYIFLYVVISTFSNFNLATLLSVLLILYFNIGTMVPYVIISYQFRWINGWRCRIRPFRVYTHISIHVEYYTICFDSASLLFIGYLFLIIIDFFFFMPFWLVYMEIYDIDFLIPSFVIYISKHHHHHQYVLQYYALFPPYIYILLKWFFYIISGL
jgi:hypothetical protein